MTIRVGPDQVPRRRASLERAARRDPRVTLVLEDLPTAAYLRLFADADVLLAPSRWEGLGVPLFEATAHGLPVITNDAPPMNELVLDGVNGVLIPSRDAEPTKSGIAAQDVDAVDLAAAIERLADDGERARLAAGARERRRELDWSHTVADLAAMLAAND